MLTGIAAVHADVLTATAKTMIDTNNGLIVIDVTESRASCHVSAHIAGAVNFSWNFSMLQAPRYAERRVDADIMVVCGLGGRSNHAANQGYLPIYEMLGGICRSY